MKITLGYIHMASWQPTDRLADDYYFDPKDSSYNEDWTKAVRDLDPEEVVLPMKQYVIRLEYPVRRPFCKDLIVNGDGLTRRQLVQAIVEAYKELYASEEDPGHIPGMFNRATSDGRYGIWGHDLGDLMLASANVSSNGIITVNVDS